MNLFRIFRQNIAPDKVVTNKLYLRLKKLHYSLCDFNEKTYRNYNSKQYKSEDFECARMLSSGYIEYYLTLKDNNSVKRFFLDVHELDTDNTTYFVLTMYNNEYEKVFHLHAFSDNLYVEPDLGTNLMASDIDKELIELEKAVEKHLKNFQPENKKHANELRKLMN